MTGQNREAIAATFRAVHAGASREAMRLPPYDNRFHDPAEAASDIAHLRVLHVELDHLVAAAYAWPDLGLGHAFQETKQGPRFTLSPRARTT